jgi:hypothetical protein
VKEVLLKIDYCDRMGDSPGQFLVTLFGRRSIIFRSYALFPQKITPRFNLIDSWVLLYLEYKPIPEPESRLFRVED